MPRSEANGASGRRAAGVRAASLLAVLAVVAELFIGVPQAVAAPKPPPNPTNGQISSARDTKNALASTIGRLSGQVAAAQSELNRLTGEAELAEQKVAFAVSQQRNAQTAADRAQARVRSAGRSVTKARRKFVSYLQATYMTGRPESSAGSLLTATNPTSLLEQGALQRFQADNKVNAIGALQRATVARSNAEASARAAVRRLRKATRHAKAEERSAANAVSAQKAQKATLQSSLSTNQTALTAAQGRLATLNGQRTAFLAYQANQRRLARIRARRLARARAARAAAAREAARLAAQARASRHHHHHSGSGSSSSGSGSSGGSSSGGSSSGGSSSGGGSSGGGSKTYSGGPSAPSGSWSASKGRRAVRRAEAEIGVPYAWAGGGASGPSYGVCDSGAGAPNDCYVKGFDCSGLALYAWGAGWDHYSVNMYNQAGSYHPSVGNLKPGDLLFYSSNGSVSGIHHVAIYKGHGEIVQAPYSGAYVETSSMYSPGSIFGITRPFT